MPEPGPQKRTKMLSPRHDGRPPISPDSVIDAACELFAERGFAGTSVRAIAEALEAHTASIFHHFPTKEDLLTADCCLSLSLTRAITHEPRRLGSAETQAAVAADVVLRGVLADPDRLGEVREAAAELPVDMSHG